MLFSFADEGVLALMSQVGVEERFAGELGFGREQVA
jgi:hypothetical protein